MKTFEEYTSEDYSRIANDIISLSNKEENELYQVLGHAINDIGVNASDNREILFERVDKSKNGISAMKAFDFVSKTKPLEKEEAENNGKRFWNNFSKKIQKAICENPTIIDIINGKSSLKDKLVVVVPSVLAFIGVGVVLGPVYITLISIALAIIIKTGLAAYCEMKSENLIAEKA